MFHIVTPPGIQIVLQLSGIEWINHSVWHLSILIFEVIEQIHNNPPSAYIQMLSELSRGFVPNHNITHDQDGHGTRSDRNPSDLTEGVFRSRWSFEEEFADILLPSDVITVVVEPRVGEVVVTHDETCTIAVEETVVVFCEGLSVV